MVCNSSDHAIKSSPSFALPCAGATSSRSVVFAPRFDHGSSLETTGALTTTGSPQRLQLKRARLPGLSTSSRSLCPVPQLEQ